MTINKRQYVTFSKARVASQRHLLINLDLSNPIEDNRLVFLKLFERKACNVIRLCAHLLKAKVIYPSLYINQVTLPNPC